jgi:immunity protein 50 of polymorphic toxin system
MVEASAFFDSGHNLISIFGEWPSFHDVEVTEVHLWRGDVKAGDWDDSNVFPLLTVIVRILEATQPNAVGDAGRDVLAKLRFHDVDDLKIEEFNHQNSILGISIESHERGTFANGDKLPPHFIITFESAFGMRARFRCSRGEIVEAKRVSDHS